LIALTSEFAYQLSRDLHADYVPLRDHYDSEKEQPGRVDLNNNVSGKVQNPLAGLSKEALIRQVDAFADQYNLTDIKPLLRTGALVAQSPHDYEHLDLEESDRQALHTEQTSRWKHTKTLYMTIIVCSIGAAVQ
jgi:hypothetical protein